MNKNKKTIFCRIISVGGMLLKTKQKTNYQTDTSSISALKCYMRYIFFLSFKLIYIPLCCDSIFRSFVNHLNDESKVNYLRHLLFNEIN
jgi:hypothetical protein